MLLGATNIETLFAITAGTFLLSAFQVARIRAEPPPAREREAAAERNVMREAFVGFTTIAWEPRLRLIMGLYCAQTLVAGALGVLVVVASIQLLDFGSAGVGYLNSAFGIGGLVGAAFAILLVARQRLASDFAIGTLLWGAPLILVGVFPGKATSLVLFALVGVGDTIVEVAAPTLLQRAVPDEILGRVFGVVESLLYAAMGIGAILAPVLVNGLGTRGALIVSGAFLPALAILAWRRLTAIDAAFGRPEGLDLLRRIAIFASAPAGRAGAPRSRAPAGARLGRGRRWCGRARPGDRFYVVRVGRARGDGRRQARCGRSGRVTISARSRSCATFPARRRLPPPPTSTSTRSNGTSSSAPSRVMRRAPRPRTQSSCSALLRLVPASRRSKVAPCRTCSARPSRFSSATSPARRRSASRLDPEALRALLARYFERMKAIVESHGGTVEKFIGDAVMAVFGVPQVHEDDALRACRAAVEMRDALPELGVAGPDRRQHRRGRDRAPRSASPPATPSTSPPASSRPRSPARS